MTGWSLLPGGLTGILPVVLICRIPSGKHRVQSGDTLWGLAQKAAMTYPDAVRRAEMDPGHDALDDLLK